MDTTTDRAGMEHCTKASKAANGTSDTSVLRDIATDMRSEGWADSASHVELAAGTIDRAVWEGVHFSLEREKLAREISLARIDAAEHRARVLLKDREIEQLRRELEIARAAMAPLSHSMDWAAARMVARS